MAATAPARPRRRRSTSGPAESEWQAIHREIMRGGGIGPSPDWPRDYYPDKVFRLKGKAPDLVAAETTIGRSDRPPWGDGGDDAAMFAHINAAYEEHQNRGRRSRAEVEAMREEREADPLRHVFLSVTRGPKPVRATASSPTSATSTATGAAGATAAKPAAVGEAVAAARKKGAHHFDDPAQTEAYLAAKESAQPSAGAGAPAAAPSSSPAAGGLSWPSLPDFEIPGGTPLVKALVVIGILLLGLAFYSRVTGKPVLLGLRGLAPTAPAPAAVTPNSAASYGAQQQRRQAVATETMLNRIAQANPARVA